VSRDSFVVERLVIHGHGAADVESLAVAEAEEPPSPGGAGHLDAPGLTGEGSPSSPEQRTSAAATIEYATPPPNVTDFVDAFHEGEEVRFRRVDNVIGEAEVPGLAVRGLDGADNTLLLMSAEEPATFVVAERDAAWQRAMLEEVKSFEDNHTWEFVDPPTGCRPIGLKWVYKVKRYERGAIVKHKARLVARGFVQREGIDFEEVFAPVARMESVLLLLVLAAAKDWQVHHLDVKSAFLNCDLAEVVFVKQPPGFVKKGEE
jgi:hypothetical protein